MGHIETRISNLMLSKMETGKIKVINRVITQANQHRHTQTTLDHIEHQHTLYHKCHQTKSTHFTHLIRLLLCQQFKDMHKTNSQPFCILPMLQQTNQEEYLDIRTKSSSIMTTSALTIPTSATEQTCASSGLKTEKNANLMLLTLIPIDNYWKIPYDHVDCKFL